MFELCLTVSRKKSNFISRTMISITSTCPVFKLVVSFINNKTLFTRFQKYFFILLFRVLWNRKEHSFAEMISVRQVLVLLDI